MIEICIDLVKVIIFNNFSYTLSSMMTNSKITFEECLKFNCPRITLVSLIKVIRHFIYWVILNATTTGMVILFGTYRARSLFVDRRQNPQKYFVFNHQSFLF
jgi:hypothetical protein